MRYRYENLSPAQFERLVVQLCKQLLGAGTQGFTGGRDGGRDARFCGTANEYPSRNSPWNGKIIIQAKHTDNPVAKYSDTDFYSDKSKTCLLAQELPKVKKLRENGELDYYILVSNRRLTAAKDNALREVIAEFCGIPADNIAIFGVDDLETYLSQYQNVAQLADICAIEGPMLVETEDLAVVIEHLAEQFSLLSSAPPVPDRVNLSLKNEVNGMSETYAKQLRKNVLKHSKQIDEFLQNPENQEVYRCYQNAVSDFSLKIAAYRKDYQDFDKILTHLIDFLCNRDPILRKHRRITTLMVQYMYWVCDIGLED